MNIASDRLTLEPLQIVHAEEMVDVLAAPALYEFTGDAPPTLQSLRERYRMQVAGSGRPDEIWRNWIVRVSDDQQAVGFIQADICGSAAELAWVISVEHQGIGYAAEAAIAVLDQLAAEGCSRFEAFIHSAHVASQAVAARLGMARTGIVDDDGEDQWSTQRATPAVR